MDPDVYQRSNPSKSQKPSHKIFSFSSNSTRPNAATSKLETNNPSFFSNISHRNTSNQKNMTGNSQPQLLRIFPPSDRFSTPQRTVPKVEPSSPAGFSGEFQSLTSPNVHSNGQAKAAQVVESHITVQSHPYLPTPSEIHRTRSRAVSQTPSLSQEWELGDADDDLSNFVNRMKEAKLRVLCANLRSQLASAQAINSELQKRISDLEAVHRSHLKSKDEELSKTRQLLDETQANQQSQQNIIAEKDQQLHHSAEQLALVQKKLQESDERITKVRDTAKKGIENLSGNYESMKAAFEQLKGRHDKSQQNVQRIRDEILDAKIAASDKFKEIEPYLDSTGRHFLKTAETRGLVQELQNDRNDAQQVIDMLRDKLHFLGAQVVEYKEKIEVLENARKEEGLNMTKSAGILESASEKVGEIADKLYKREKEDAELAAEGLKLEIFVTEANERIECLKKDLAAKEKEVESLVVENRKLKFDMDIKSTKLDDALQLNGVNVERLDTCQAQVRSQEKEIGALKERLDNSEKAGQVLQANVGKTESQVVELESELRSSKAVELATRTKLEHTLEKVKSAELEGAKMKKEYEEKIRQSQGKVDKLHKDCEDGEVELRHATSRLAVLQERFDSQSMMLKLAKEHGGDLQERLLLSEKANATKLEATEGKYKAVIAVTAEQKSVLQAQLDQLHTVFERLQSSEKAKAMELAVMAEQKSALQEELNKLRPNLVKLEATENKYKTEITAVMAEKAALKNQLEKLGLNLSTLETTASKHKTEIALLEQQKASIQTTLDQQTADLNRLKTQSIALSNSEAEKAVLAEQNLALRTSLDQLKQDYRKLESQNVLTEKIEELLVKQLDDINTQRAKAAERGLECASAQVKELKEELGNMKAMIKDSADAQAELARLQEREAIAEEALAKVSGLENEIERARQREVTLQERYKEGQLSDPEKELVDYIIRTNQAMNEYDMVEKENELRRRDNQNNALQAKIDNLESTLAKLLKKYNGQQGQSMVDLNIWMTSPLSSASDTQPQAGPALIVSTSTKPKPKLITWSSTTPPPNAQPRSFAELDEEDDDDDDDDEEERPLVTISRLGKRSRPSSPTPVPVKVEEREREPKGTARKADHGKDSDQKPKTKKRR
uniref:Uncharacterized protein n=1 Tax=Moniliophthora roreri TaxID=221103 RepID=A0A0W0GFB4_MONRR